MAAILETNDLHVTIGAPILRGVSLSIERGTLFGLIGPAASGKTVLIKSLAALLPATSGDVFVDGVDMVRADEIKRADVRARIGMLFQNYALFDHMTVGENIAFPLRRLTRMSDGEIADRVAERLRQVSLPGFEDRATASLSGGQRRRVGIARANVANPPILFYDEPTAGLDPVTSQKIYDLLRREQRETGATVIAISSDVNGLFTIADRVGLMHKGELVFVGAPDAARQSSIPVVRQFVNGLTEGPL